ncbi:MAG: LCP family protein [Anaerolineae bacterium]|nr:LCP family protein [Anaerolineae bacterium]
MTRLPQLRRHRPRSVTAYWPVAFVAVLAGIALLSFTQQGKKTMLDVPLGPTLPAFGQETVLLTPTAVVAGSVPVGTVLTPTPVEGPSDGSLQGPSLPSGDPLCDGPQQLILLVIGTDQMAGYDKGLADAIRVVRIDFVTPSVSVLAFPRDLWVTLPGLEGRGSLEEYFGNVTLADGTALQGDYSRINVAYFYGNLYHMPGGGQTLMAQTIYTNFGIPTENYVVMNMQVFEDMIDAIGGVDIEVPKDLNDYQKGWFFKKGWQHLDGKHALQYARIRHTDNDFGRVERQTQVLMAVRDKIVQPQTLADLALVISDSLDDMLTDLTMAKINSLVCLVPQVEPDRIQTYAVTEDMITSVRTSKGAAVLLPNYNAISGVIYEFLYGAAY